MKKGDKSLNMIFGLFLLLIISLVVLNLFFKFTEKSTKSLESSSTEYYSKAAIENVKQQCNQLCEGIQDINGLIEFCGKSFAVDWNGNKIIKGEKVRLGKWEFCEEKIPCFVLKDDCPNANGAKCKEILINPESNSCDYYNALAKGGFDDGCKLTDGTGVQFIDNKPLDINGNPAPDGIHDEPTPNWKLKYNFDISQQCPLE